MNLDLLKRAVSGEAQEAAASAVGDLLGEFACFVLKPDLRVSAGIHPPVLPLEAGSTGAFFVWNQKELGSPLKEVIQPAFFLTLCWKATSKDSRWRLPAGLEQVAQNARDALARECKPDDDRKKVINSFGLDLADVLGEADLSGFSFMVDSAWAPLTAGLAIAVYGGKPRSDVFATGAWNASFPGVRQVDGIRAKVEAAISLAPGPVFFVPRANLGEALVASGEQAEIADFPVAERSASVSLTRYLRALAAPPRKADGASLADRCAYANLDFIASDQTMRGDYYRRELLVDLAEDLAVKSGAEFKIRRLALGLSKNWDLDAFLVRALKPSEARFLSSPETTGVEPDVRRSLQDLRNTSFAPPVELSAHNADECCDSMTDWLQQDADGAAVDITAGRTDMSAVLLVAARRSRTRILYLRHETRGPVPLYGTGNMISLDWALK